MNETARTREEFNSALHEVGVWALYTRTDRRFPCRTCTRAETVTSRPDCLTCYGTGYKTVLEPWLVQWANSLRRPAQVDPVASRMGISAENIPVVISRAKDVPVSGDRFFFVDWDVEWENVPRGGRPVNVIQGVQVGVVDPFFIREVIYYISYTTYLTEQLNVYERSILKAPIEPARL